MVCVWLCDSGFVGPIWSQKWNRLWHLVSQVGKSWFWWTCSQSSLSPGQNMTRAAASQNILLWYSNMHTTHTVCSTQILTFQTPCNTKYHKNITLKYFKVLYMCVLYMKSFKSHKLLQTTFHVQVHESFSSSRLVRPVLYNLFLFMYSLVCHFPLSLYFIKGCRHAPF